jgi:signal transduction histidine kinase
VANAVEHNRPGGRVEITTRAAGRRAVLRVENSGPVIATEDLDGLFRPFARLDGARTGETGGLGLGLSIVKAIADAHRATLGVAPGGEGGLAVEVAFRAIHRNPPSAREAVAAGTGGLPDRDARQRGG